MKTVKIMSQTSDTEYTYHVSDDTYADMMPLLARMRDGQYLKSAGGRVFSSDHNMQRFIAWIAPRQSPADGSEPATERQIAYLLSLRVVLEPALSKHRASQLINAAKNDSIGSTYGFYTDGSN